MPHEALCIPGEGVFPLLKPLVGFKQDILFRLERSPYDRNVFLMLRFRDSNQELSRYIADTLDQYGFRGVRADQLEWNITDDVYNSIAVLYCCKYGLALFDEAEEGQTFNPNVVYELGVMQSQRKNCLILKHRTLPQVPFNLSKNLARPYDCEQQIRQAIGEWIKAISMAVPSRSGGKPDIVTIEDEDLVPGASLAKLATLGLRDVASQLGRIDLKGLFAGARNSVDVVSPLSFAGLQGALVELRNFIRYKRGTTNFLLLDPSVISARDQSDPQIMLQPLRRDYSEELNEMSSQVRLLGDQKSKGTVSLYFQGFPSGYSLYRIDDLMIVAPWNDGLEAEANPCLVIERRDDPGGMFVSYLRAYENLIRRRSARLTWTNRADAHSPRRRK